MLRIRVFFLVIASVIHVTACGRAGILEDNEAVFSNSPSAQTPASPQVSAGFQPLIAQLTGEGLRLKEAMEASLEPGARHLAATFERPGAKDPSARNEFRIFETDGGTTKTIFRRTDFFFSFAATGEMQKLNGTDITGAGFKAVIVQSSGGGNCWSCNPTEIYRVRNHRGELIAAGPIQRITDLKGDGARELIVVDARWESYDDLSHAASPTALIVYAWRGGRYVYASREFPEFYKTEVARLTKAIEAAKADITTEDFSDESYVGSALALAITYAHAGDLEGGLNLLGALLGANSRSANQTRHRAEMLEDFRKGGSNRKLHQMNQGDAMPLG